MNSSNQTRKQLVLQDKPIGRRELCLNHEAFIIYVRTLQFMKTRLKGIDQDAAVHVPLAEIESRFFPFPKFSCKQELQNLVDEGLLQINERISPKTGNKMFTYEAAKPGKVDLYLINSRARKYDPVVLQMIVYLKLVSIDTNEWELPPYFESFLNFRDDCINLVVTVDDFAGRLITPVTNLHRSIRPHLLIEGSPTIGIDVVTMQPLLLGKILKQEIGDNEFSNWLDSGLDVYIMLQEKAGLETRDQGKKRFFEILFSPPNNELNEMFGNATWIDWINQYKRQKEPRNPHSVVKPHSNLAWLLQSTEVSLMREVWQRFILADIPFLSIHDEVIVKQSDYQKAEAIFRAVLDKEFNYFKLNGKEAITATPNNEQQDTLPHPEDALQACLMHSEPLFVPTQYLKMQSRQEIRHDYFGADGILHTHWPGLPEIV